MATELMATDLTTDSPQTPPAPETLHGAPVSYSRGQKVLHATREDYLKVVRSLKDDGFAMCVDLCGVDQLTNEARSLSDGVVGERYEVVVNLLSLTKRERIRVRVQLPADDPSLGSLYELYAGTEAMEREAFDLVGIVFENHPDLTRILLPDDWEGHPLRKDYAVGRIPVQFKDAPQPR